DEDQLFEHNIFRDMDYSILGEHWSTYVIYFSQLKTEYAMVDKYDQFVKGRIEFLEKTLKDRPVFKSGLLGLIFEVRAMENMRWELRILK
ncbi:MAG: hypothetical protein ACTSSO_07380, partial [Candidatus Hodarchaeales archaeon]